MRKANKNQYPEQPRENSLKFIKNLLIMKQLYWQKVSNLFQLPQYRLHIKAFFEVFTRYVW